MTAEEARKRAEAADRKQNSEKSKEYYRNNREKVLARMKKYDAEHKADRRAREAGYRKTAKYAETMIRYWTRKLNEAKEREK